MPSLMLKSVYAEFDGKQTPTIIDLGYTSDRLSRERYEALRAFGLPRKRFCVEGFGRVLAEVPPTKVAKVLAAFPIVAGETYFRTTHHWQGLGPGELSCPPSEPTMEK